MSTTQPSTETRFVNEMRLNGRQWGLVLVLVGLVLLMTPRAWRKIERFDTGSDYRIPYHLSKDYWLYQWRLQRMNAPSIVMLGDSVIWGEYVLPEGTWTHFLNQQIAEPGKFVNGGVNGLFPLALEGLIHHYGLSLHHQKIVLHCNLLWLSNPKADLQVEKEEKFNHSRLVPQLDPSLRCYRADANERLGVIAEQQIDFLAWINHLQNVYFDQKNLLNWTLQNDGGNHPHYTNSYRNPLAQITFQVPPSPLQDPQRGPLSPRHKSWMQNGAGPSRFEWVDLKSSFQWAAFQRLIRLLQQRGNDIFVILGPFNEHMIAEENRPAYLKLREGVEVWLKEHGVPHLVPAALSSVLYADASHPLTEGYEQLAQQTLADEDFRHWMNDYSVAKTQPPHSPGYDTICTYPSPGSGGVELGRAGIRTRGKAFEAR